MSDSNITAFDVKLLMGLLIGVVAISIVFPMAGLGSPDGETSSVPTFDPEANQVDLAGDFPTRPDTETGGVLVGGPQIGASEQYRVLYDETDDFGENFSGSRPLIYNETRLFVVISDIPSIEYPTGDGSGTAGYSVTAYATNSELPVTLESDGTQQIDQTALNYTDSEWVNRVFIPYDYQGSKTIRVETGDTGTQLSATFTVSPQRSATGYYRSLEAELPTEETTVITPGTDLADAYNEYQSVDGTLHSTSYSIDSVNTPDDTGIVGSLPVVGGLFGSGSDILAGIFLLIEQVAWAFGTLFTLVINTVITVASGGAYILSLVGYLIGSYASVLAAAPGGLAATVLAFPGILLAVQGFRMVVIIVNTVWVG